MRLPPALTAAALAAAVAVAAGCGGDDEAPAGATAQRGPATTLAQDYTDGEGRERSVDARLAVVAVHPPAGELPVALPEGTEPVVADVEIDDRGADPFPVQWTAFSARTREGRTLEEQLRLSPRRVRDGVQTLPVGFAVPAGDDVVEVRVRSIVTLWPFAATLSAPGG